MSILELNVIVILLSIIWWAKVLPERSYLSSLVVSFALGTAAAYMELCFHRMGMKNDPSLADQTVTIWFFVLSIACGKMIWNDRFSKTRARIGRVPKDYRRPID